MLRVLPIRRLLLLLAVLSLVGVGWAARSLSVAEVVAWMQSPPGGLLSLGLMALAAMTAFPAEVIALSNGVVYGPWLGTGMTWLGAMLGAGLAYGLAQRLAPPPGPLLQRITAAAEDPWALLTIRLIPLFPFFLVNYACGLARVPPLRFFWTTAAGILPMSLLLSGLGDGVRRQPAMLLLLLPLALLSAGIALLRRRRPPA